MAHRTMGELMTRKVVSVRLDTPFKDTVRTLADNAVSAVPVFDGPGRPAGIVSVSEALAPTGGDRGMVEERCAP
ncbi:CBS domain-containing protein [Streptomyces lydicus]|uniref:CBS domain-containing protein n=1 Tax=Streptomyces lydicus TaxID=47763 RepID=UPI00367A5DE3